MQNTALEQKRFDLRSLSPALRNLWLLLVYLYIFFTLPQIVTLKAELAKAGKPSGFAMLDSNGRLPHSLLDAGYDKYSAYDLAWQSLHMAAAAACRGSTASGRSGSWDNQVMTRNTADKKTCAQISAQTIFRNCDA